jgi:hypothetical protein
VAHEVPIKKPDQAEKELVHTTLAVETPVKDEVKHDFHHGDEKEGPLYHGELGYHIPVIKDGVPLDTVSVQVARAEHLAVVAKSEKDDHEPKKDEEDHKGYKYAQAVYLNLDEKEPELHNLYKREIHEHTNEKEQLYNGEYGFHIPVIKNGVPANTVSVQIARAEHFAAVAKEEGDEHKPEKYEEETEYAKVVFLNKDEKEPKLHLLYKRSAGEFYDGKHGYHYPTIKNGVPVDTAEVQHARAAHLAKLHAEEAHSHDNSDDDQHHEDDSHYDHHDYDYHHHEHHEEAPLGKDGRVVDTHEVAHAKAEHYAAIAKAGGYATGYDYSDDHYSHDYKHEDHHHEHAPLGHDGRVVDTHEVAHAKAEHYAAIAKAGGYATGYDHSDDHYAHDYKHEDHSDYHYDGKYGYHYPTIKNGVPVDTAEVQHARAFHLAKLHAGGHGYADSYDHDNYHHSEGPKETPEVQHLKAKHAAAHAEAVARLHHHHKRSADYHHVPVIHNGVPIDTPAVQHAKAAHFAAYAAAAHGHYDAGHHDEHHDDHHHDYHHEDKKYDGKYGYHYPTIKNGVPVEPEAVQHERADHFARVAAFKSGNKYAPAHSYYGHHGDYHVPAIHNGVPVDTPEVQHAKAAHFAAVAEAKAHAGHSYGHYEEEKHW